jgi:hypothetical protein
MLVLTAFLSICAVGVAFLLRFLFALESDLRAHGKHTARVERIHSYRVPARSEAGSPAPVLIHSNPGLAQPRWRDASAVEVRAGETYRAKQA